MAVTVRPPRNTDPPEFGTRYWEPNDMADVVFPEPENRRSLVVDAAATQRLWDRVVEEVRWLHDIIEAQETRLAVFDAGEPGEVHRQAVEEGNRIVGQARLEAGRLMGQARQDAERLQADALDRIAAASNGRAPQLVELPPLDVNDLRGSMLRRLAHVQRLTAEVEGDAQAMLDIGAEVQQHLESGELVDPPEVETAPSSLGPAVEFETLVNESDREVTIRFRGAYRVVLPGDSITMDRSCITPSMRTQMSSPEKPRDWRAPGDDEPAVRILRDQPQFGLREGDIIAFGDLPPNVLFESITGQPLQVDGMVPDVLTTGELKAIDVDPDGPVPYDGSRLGFVDPSDDATLQDRLAEDQAIRDDHEGDALLDVDQAED